ncbi:MAG TPA: tRNA (adenosine(37)-N6)-dimethylallyltransferase MiaA [Candidatus Limnocylindrales bacterium]|nr:tRNA (adenosine(37)-N6)-dimethylallyltransferase MiaA [Candidatus Limnocylindrales bacterium]
MSRTAPASGEAGSGLLRLPSRVLVVAGPTASGKSELAIVLAEALGGEIVGADSRQVFRYMDVGTAKPTADQRRRAAHHLIDVVDPDAAWDVAAWRNAALASLAGIHARGRVAVVCGGTGLYLRSLAQGLFPGPPADPAVRTRLEADELANPGSAHARLGDVDPATARRVHSNDLVRTIRALEVFETTGRPLSAWLAEHGLADRPFQTLTLEVDIERDELRERIGERSRRMVDDGIVDELASLYARGYGPATRAFDAIGYRQAALCLEGKLARSDLADAIALATVQYAKRQRTWLRGQMKTVKVPASIASQRTGKAVDLARAFFS